MELSKRDTRKLFISQQGLLRDNAFGRGPKAVEKAINRLSYLQIDTISVVNRAHEHILFSRIKNFQPEHLNKLMLDRTLYEYWSHAAAFMPFSNYRYSLPMMQGWKATRSTDKKLARAILQRIRADGPLQSKDFEAPAGHKSGGWWEWKPAKQVLEHLFLTGDLMVSHRQGFQKVFDLPENVIPVDTLTHTPTDNEWAEFLVRSMIGALGVATEYDLGYSKNTIRRFVKKYMGDAISDAINKLVKDGELIEVTVEGKQYFSTEALLDNLPLRCTKKTVRFLSPFDNLVINRRRALELFEFDYQIECYLPAEKRVYGYFSLPMLYGDELIGRTDAKANRKTGILEVKNLVLHRTPDDALIEATETGLLQLMLENRCTGIAIEKSKPASLRKKLAV